MKFFFIRHGQSSNNIIEEIPDINHQKYEELRSRDPNLSDLGKTQLELVAEYLKKNEYQIKKVYTSALIRALESASILKNKLKCEVEVMVNICEEGGMYQQNKVFNGINKEEVEKNFPGFLLNQKEITEKGWFFQDHRENKEEFYNRAFNIVKFIQNLAKENKDKNEVIIFISHGNFLNQEMHILLEMDKKSEFFFSHDNGAITCFETKDNGDLLLNYFNFTEHLENLMAKL